MLAILLAIGAVWLPLTTATASLVIASNALGDIRREGKLGRTPGIAALVLGVGGLALVGFWVWTFVTCDTSAAERAVAVAWLGTAQLFAALLAWIELRPDKPRFLLFVAAAGLSVVLLLFISFSFGGGRYVAIPAILGAVLLALAGPAWMLSNRTAQPDVVVRLYALWVAVPIGAGLGFVGFVTWFLALMGCG